LKKSFDLGRVMKYKHLIWDWNGTLLDDVDIVIDAMNNLLGKRDLKLLDRDTYRNIFTFPVKNYYAHLGFDFNVEPFEKLANEYISQYDSDKYVFKLFEGATEILGCLKEKGIEQSVLSACEQDKLLILVEHLGIRSYFIKVKGIDNHYAEGKRKVAFKFLSELNLNPDTVLMIGDTQHDFEVAKEIGCDCLLISNGHQSHERLKKMGVNVIKDIQEVLHYFE